MKKNFSFITLCLVASLVFFVVNGCQTQSSENPSAQNKQESALDEKYAVPHSNGPSTPPSVKGPTDLPPGESQPQAVTEKENIRLTLPLKNS